MKTDIFEQIEFEDLTEDLKMLAEACGLDTVRKMLKFFGGLNFYIPKISRLDKFILKYLSQNKEKSQKQIARELNVSEYFLRVLQKRNRKSVRAKDL